MAKRHRIHTVNRRKKKSKVVYLNGKALFPKKLWYRIVVLPFGYIGHIQELPSIKYIRERIGAGWDNASSWLYDWYKLVERESK